MYDIACDIDGSVDDYVLIMTLSDVITATLLQRRKIKDAVVAAATDNTDTTPRSSRSSSAQATLEQDVRLRRRRRWREPFD